MFGVSALSVVTAFLPLLNVDWWWVRAGDFPRVQLLVLYLATIALLAIWFRRRSAQIWMLALFAAVGLQLYWIWPYTPLATNEVELAESNEADVRLRLMSANVLEENRDVDRLLDQIREEQPDVLVLLEVNQWWIDQLDSLDQQFTYQLEYPLENTYGIAFYTNLEVVDARVREMVEADIPSIDARVKSKSGTEVRLFAVHPKPPSPGDDTTHRDAELVLVGREIKACECTAIVFGDLNDVGWSSTTQLFQKISGLLDPRIGRGMYSTYSAHSWFLRYPLDYLFHSDDFRLVELKRLADFGSDHFPLLVELSYEPLAQVTQEAPPHEAGDHDRAQDAIDKSNAGTQE